MSCRHRCHCARASRCRPGLRWKAPPSAKARAVDRWQRLHVSSPWILYAILDDVCDEYMPVVEVLESESEAIDAEVLTKDAHEQPHMLQ